MNLNGNSFTKMPKIQDALVCSGCGSPFIVNKKYCLCDQCNFKRTHGGRSKNEVYQERAFERQKKKQLQPKKEKKPEIKIKRLSSISDTNRLRCSDGSLITRQELEKRYRETCNEIKIERDPVCEGLGGTQYPLSFSHTISRKRCIELGKAELIYDKNNLELEGFHEPSSFPKAAHNIWETGNWKQKIELLNIQRKLDYIEQHDPEKYRKIKLELFEIGLSIA